MTHYLGSRVFFAIHPKFLIGTFGSRVQKIRDFFPELEDARIRKLEIRQNSYILTNSFSGFLFKQGNRI